MQTDLGTPHLRLERRASLAWCVIDRPQARNALTSRMYFGIRRAVDLVNSDPDLHCLIITGVDDVFCPGGDLRRDVQEADKQEAILDVGALIGNDVLPFKTIRQSRAPIISAINGICQGGSLCIAMLSDISVASERATFRAPELLRGIVDPWYAQIMPAHIGIAMTRDMMFSGRRLSAPEAVQYGLIDDVTFSASLRGPEVREGMRAFVEKRPPAWLPEDLRSAGRL